MVGLRDHMVRDIKGLVERREYEEGCRQSTGIVSVAWICNSRILILQLRHPSANLCAQGGKGGSEQKGFAAGSGIAECVRAL